jgi:muramoyltetrapeptide carboxypeptidase
MAVSDREQFARRSFVDDLAKGFVYDSGNMEQPVTGDAKGILYGGCLSMLAASLGTPYAVETEGAILFIEDIATKPYQIDRMLMQLRLAGKLSGVKGICFGEMVDCVQPGGQSYSLVDVIRNVLSDLKIPVGIGLRSGHIALGAAPNLCLPFGVPVTLKVAAEQATLAYQSQ